MQEDHADYVVKAQTESAAVNQCELHYVPKTLLFSSLLLLLLLLLLLAATHPAE